MITYEEDDDWCCKYKLLSKVYDSNYSYSDKVLL